MFSQKCSGAIHRTSVVAEFTLQVVVRCLIGLVLCSGLVGNSFAQEFEIEKIVVTAKKGYERDVQSIPANITVITSDDIAKSNARTVADLLRSEAGLVVRDLLGNGGQVSVDIRGFGESAQMNCAILIDGRRVNNIDMSNPDLTQISLAQIERIEILRGGASTLYGDGAIGGVINIITKKAKRKELTTSISFNAFNGSDLKFGIEDVKEEIAYSINGNYRFSQGYRLHNEMNAGDIGLRMGKKENGLAPGWDLSAGFHFDNYQLPGYLNQTDWDSGYYWKTYTPDDKGDATDWYSMLAVKKSIGDLKTETEISLRSRNAYTFVDSWFTYDKRYTRILGAGEKLSYNLFGIDLLGGIEYYGNSYRISPDNRTGDPTPGNDDQIMQRNSTAGYIQFIAPLFKVVSLEGGGRLESVNQHFVVESAPSDTFKLEILDALYAGLNLEVLRGINVYARWSKSFRLPKTDEYYTWGTFNPRLKPQKSEDIEWGVKYAGEKIATTLSLFLTRVVDEIYHESYPAKPMAMNENAPNQVIRCGGELRMEIHPLDFVSLSLGYTLTDARFDTGIGTIGGIAVAGKEIPLVPRHKGDIRLRVNLPLDINLGVNCTMVSDRWFGSDYTQNAGRLSGYTVVDLNFSRRFENLRLFGAITNIGDTKYAETAWAGFYYPSPARNFAVGMEVNL